MTFTLMGRPNEDLILPGYLHLHPKGLSAESIAEKLSRMRIPGIINNSDPWRIVDEKYANLFYQGGLDTVAYLLGLPLTKAFQTFQEQKLDGNGLTLYPPNLDYYGEEGAQVSIHLRNKIAEPKEHTIFSYVELSPGKQFECALTSQVGFVDEVIKMESIYHPEEEDEFSAPIFEYTIRGRAINPVHEVIEFDSLEAVYNRFPQFHPYHKYDFSQTEGNFFSKGYFPPTYMSWYKGRDGKYRINPETYKRIPPSFTDSNRYSLQDLELAAYAIKKKAWWLFAYNGQRYLDRAFAEGVFDPEVYEQICSWTQFAKYAESRNMTLFERMKQHLSRETTDWTPNPERL